MNNNIETKINMVYDFNYSKSFDNNMKSFNIMIDNIMIDDIKIKNSTSSEHTDTIVELLKGKFKLIEIDQSEVNQIVLKRYTDGLSVSLFISPYKSYETISQITSMNNNDCLFSYILSTLVLNKKVRHILLPIINIDVDFQQIIDIVKPYDKSYRQYIELMESNSISNVFSIRVKENFFKCMTLREHIESNQVNIKLMLFQIIITLASLQKEYKGFRHNMLNSNNIYIYLKKESDIAERYEFDTTNFYILNNNIDIKITNFFAATIPKQYVSSMEIPFINNDVINDYFDLHYFLNILIEMIELPSDKTDELNVFLDKVIPNKYRSKKNNHYMEDYVELFKPSELLQDEYFKEYTTTQPSNMTGKKYTIKKSEKKSKKFLSIDSQDKLVGGSGKFFKPSNEKVKNSPYISNENRRIWNADKPFQEKLTRKLDDKEEQPEKIPEKKVDKNEPVVIASQEVVMNPSYKKPFKPMEKSSWDRSYVKFDDKKEVLDNPGYKPAYDNKSDYKPPYETKPEYKKSDYKPPYDNKKPYEKDFTETRHINQYDNKYNKSEEYYRPQKLQNATEGPLLAEQKIYQSAFTGGPAKSTDHTHPKYTNPAFISLDNNIMYPQSFVPELGGYFPFTQPLNKVNELPLQNIYNINLGNPSVHSNFLSRIYEDTLPGDPFNFTMKSVFERNHLISFMRNSMIKNDDGEEMTMQVGQNSFLEYIRMLEFNPFGLGGNPYSAIAPNFLIYGGSYPIRYNTETRMIEIAKHSMAVCIRMYMMTQGAMNYKNLGLANAEDYFDVYREIKYYKWVKTELLDKKVCPNFTTMILYKFDKQSNINWNQLYSIIGKYTGAGAIERSRNLSQQINNALQPAYTNKLNRQGINLNQVGLHLDSNTSMVLLTESPTYNLIEWASPIYQTNGVIRTMTSSGYHSPDVWKSVLFQLAYAMAVLQEKEIYFRGFDVKYNVFIKDVSVSNTNIGYWIYKINDVEFYVPNYGYIVLIDSSYIQVEERIPPSPVLPAIPLATPHIALPLVLPVINFPIGAPVVGAPPPIAFPLGAAIPAPVFLYKVLSPIYTTNGNDDPSVNPRPLVAGQRISWFKRLIRDDFIRVMTRANFTNNFNLQTNMEAPDPDILALIDRMNALPTAHIAESLIEFFPDFLHNKVGTLLMKTERDMLNPNIMPNFNNIRGKLIVYQERYDEYKWAIYLGPVIGNPRQQRIYFRDNVGNYVDRTVFNHSLVHFPEVENVEQIGNRPYKITKDALIETYIF